MIVVRGVDRGGLAGAGPQVRRGDARAGRPWNTSGLVRSPSTGPIWHVKAGGDNGRRDERGMREKLVAVPNWEAFMVPALEALADGDEVHLSEIRERIADVNALNLTPADMLIKTRKGTKTQFEDRVHWATYSMRRAGLLESTKRGSYRITPEGKRILARDPTQLSDSDLREYQGYREWKDGTQEDREPQPQQVAEAETEAEEQSCGNCCYFLLMQHADHVQEEDVGACVYFPPTPMPSGQPLRPVVVASNWCGQWRDVLEDVEDIEKPPLPAPTQRLLMPPEKLLYRKT